MVREENPGRDGGDEIGYRLREPDAIKRPKVAQQVNRRDQEDNLPAQTEKHRFPGDADALEELADDDLRPDTEKGQHRQDKAPVRNARQLRIGGESADNRRGKEQADDPPEDGDRRGDRDRQLERRLDPVEAPRPVVEPEDGLRPLRQADDQHDEQHGDARDDAARANGQVAPVALQRMVHDDDHQAAGHLHGEGRDADRQDVPDDPPLEAEIARMEADDAPPVDEMGHDEDGAGDHRDGRRDGGAADAHVENQDKQGVENDIEDGAQHHRDHRLLGIARGPHDGVEVERQVGEEIAGDDDIEVIHGVGQGLLAAAETRQQLLHENHAGNDRRQVDDQRQGQGVAQDMLGRLVRLAPQVDGDSRGRPGADQHAEGLQEKQDGERQRQARDGHRADPLPDKDPVDNVIKRVDHRTDDSGDGVMEKQGSDPLVLQLLDNLVIHLLKLMAIQFSWREITEFSKRYCLNPGEYSTRKPCPVESAQMI